MNTGDKFSIWIIVLLLWNAGLLTLLMIMLYIQPHNIPDPDTLARSCAAAAATTLQTACLQR